jgi:general secretion pathway protein G
MSLSFGDKVAVGMILFVVADTITVALAVEIGRREPQKAQRARLDISTLKRAVDTYYAQTGRYPEQLSTLVDARVLLKLDDDPWGHEYRYAILGGKPVITSLGKDGTPGGEGNDSDISSEEHR